MKNDAIPSGTIPNVIVPPIKYNFAKLFYAYSFYKICIST